MPAIENHPLRIARLAGSLTTHAVAEELGISRGLVTAIEEGRVRKVRPEYVALLARRNGTDPKVLQHYYDEWRQRFENRLNTSSFDRLSPRARAVLQLPPHLVTRYSSFTAWRQEFSKSTAGFASLLMVSATSLARYERGEADTLPKTLVRAFTRTLGMSPEYLEAVMALPVVYREPAYSAGRSRRRKKEAPSATQLLRDAEYAASQLGDDAYDIESTGGAVPADDAGLTSAPTRLEEPA
jgi:transcriptional regulator with XRE-family HTH domain